MLRKRCYSVNVKKFLLPHLNWAKCKCYCGNFAFCWGEFANKCVVEVFKNVVGLRRDSEVTLN
jgi:hypothetical protein